MNKKIVYIVSAAVIAGAVVSYFMSVKKSPEEAAKFAQQGVELTRDGKFDKAIESYNDSLDARSDPTVFYNRGVAYMNKGDFTNAIRDFTKAIELQPDNAFAFNNRAFVYKNKGNFDDAIKDYSEVIRLKPDFSVAYYGRGFSYQAKGEKEKALADYKKALSLGYSGAEKNIKELELK